MAVKLTIVEPHDPVSEFRRSFTQDRIAIGRARSADVCLPDMAVSTRHAEIRLRGTDYTIVDVGSVNGTLVNGRKIVPMRPVQLRNGDAIAVAGFKIGFELGVAAGPADPRDAALRQAREMMARFLARSASAEGETALVVVSGPARASRFALPPPPGRVSIGRGAEVDVSVEDRDVSRRHAEVVIEADGVFVRDLGSRNGVVVDGERVEAARLVPGGQFKIGATTMALESAAERSLSAIFEAPEEETASFSLAPPGAAAGASAEEEAGSEEEAPAEADEAPFAPPPVGPSDPLVGDGLDPAGLRRTTGEIPRPVAEPAGDLWLILIGAIAVIAAVVGLVYLLG